MKPFCFLCGVIVRDGNTAFHLSLTKGAVYMRRYAAITALMSAVLLSGCASQYVLGNAELGSAPAYGTEIAWDGNSPVEEQDGPPALRIELMTEETASVVTLDRSTFTWDGLCVDCISPLESYENGYIRATVSFDDLTEPPRLLLPDNAYITDVQCWGRDGADYSRQNVKFNDEGEIFLPDEPIGVVYDICVKFDGSNSCHYIFAERTEKASGAVEGSEQNTPAYDPSQQMSKPPVLALLASTNGGAQELSLSTGNYSWTVVKGDEAAEMIACGASPLQSAANGNAVVIPTADELNAAPLLKLTDGARIAEVRVWQSEDKWSSAEFTADGDILLADSGKGCVYSVSVEFPQGTAEYVFMVEELCGYPTIGDMIGSGDDAFWLPEATITRTDDFDGWTGFDIVTSADARVPQYGEDFFEHNALIVTTITESSGSISHEFNGIDRDNVIHIGRYCPMVGTCDMAQYTVIIEIPAELAGEDFTVVYDTVYGDM